MKKVVLVAMVMGLVIGLTGCGSKQVTGNGDITSKARQVPVFDHIRVAGNFTIDATSGAMQAVQITTSSNIIPFIVTTVEGGVLDIHVKPNHALKTRGPIKIKLAAKKLMGISASGVVKLQAQGVDSETFALRTRGAAKATLSGQAKTVSINIAGEGWVNASALKGDNVTVGINGDGAAQVFATKELHVNINGSGHVTYAGKPKVLQKIHGSGRVQEVTKK